MIIGSIPEDINIDKRVAVTPEILKKYKSLGLEVYLTKNYATHLGILDKEYEEEGATLFENEDDVLSKSDAILQMSILNDANLKKLRSNQILIGVLNPYLNEKKLNPIIKEYMEKNSIRMVIDKKSILLADDNLDITKEIVKLLKNKLKSIKLK